MCMSSITPYWSLGMCRQMSTILRSLPPAKPVMATVTAPRFFASSAALITLGELPEPEIMTTTSPLSTRFSIWRENSSS